MTVASTSLLAYIEVVPTLGRRQNEVLGLFEHNPGRAFTNAEIGRELGWEINTVTPRVKELRDRGVLEEKGERLCSRTGRRAKAWGKVTRETLF